MSGAAALREENGVGVTMMIMNVLFPGREAAVRRIIITLKCH